MFGRRFPIFKLFGFQVYIDLSWFILALLITWTLAVGFFPFQFPGLSPATYWWMGIAGAVGLFLSIVLHELSHSLVARRNGVDMRGITLFVFGGVAEMDAEPPDAKSEFKIAVAGPISSILIGIFCLGLFFIGAATWPLPVTAVLVYLGWINIILAIFNMVPAFPLDGGRILRSALWYWKGSLPWATRISANFGSAFGLFLIFLGVLQLFYGNFIGAMWWFLIGLFLRSAAQMSYQQMMVRQALHGEPVRRFMKTDPVTVPPFINIKQLVEDYVYRFHHKMFPVVREDRLVGCVNTRQLKEMPREEWDQHTVAELAQPCSRENTISPDADAVDALAQMSKTDKSRLMVVEGDRLVAIVSLRDLLEFLSLKMDLEGEDQDQVTLPAR